mmetsp:Transcript_47867/g.94818  ORF Transcript_47867/g.94818 Transcript_47867/m.94818 type:complete len:365 (-) Transcript_47867:11-1105(-)
MRHFGNAKKAAKPTEDVLKSQIFQAIKAVSKAVKIVKTFLVLKCTKKISTLRDGANEKGTEEKINQELEWLDILKSIDQQVLAGAIVRMKVLFGNDPRYNTTDKALDNTINESLLRTMLRHKRIEETLSEIKQKITTTIEKNNELRAKEQAKIAKGAKPLFSKKDGYVDGTKAVFMESLDGAGSTIEQKTVTNKDLVKLNKSLRNQANRLANKSKKATGEETHGAVNDSDQAPRYAGSKRQRKEDNDPSMMMYRPLDQRFPTASTTTNSTSSSGAGGGRPSRTNGSNHNTRTGAVASKPKPKPMPVVEDLTKAASFGKEWKTTGVHPSWAAKQHAKKQTVGSIPPVAAGGGGGAVLGKKIVFDD